MVNHKASQKVYNLFHTSLKYHQAGHVQKYRPPKYHKSKKYVSKKEQVLPSSLTYLFLFLAGHLWQSLGLIPCTSSTHALRRRASETN